MCLSFHFTVVVPREMPGAMDCLPMWLRAVELRAVCAAEQSKTEQRGAKKKRITERKGEKVQKVCES